MPRSENELPRVSADLPQIDGVLKSRPEDFVVEEIPAYAPCGEGEHLFLWIQKVDLAADELLQRVARTLLISTRDIGTAGTKDRRAVTRQYLSVPAKAADRIERLANESISVLDCRRHRNKLRTGHLRGNRFEIIVRGVAEGDDLKAAEIGARIRAHGFPNYYGEQRFGQENRTLALGFELLNAEKTPDEIPASRRRFLLRMALSSVQSHLFNLALAERIRDGLLHSALEGDVMELVTSGARFLVEDAPAEQVRLAARVIAPTGPMFGPRMMRPTGAPADRESRILAASGLSESAFERFASLTQGTRRPYLVWPEDLEAASHEEGLRFRFACPRRYATSLLREFLHRER